MRADLVRRSRDRTWLLKAALVLVATSLGLAFFVSLIGERLRASAVEAALSPPSTVAELVPLIRFGQPGEQNRFSCARLERDGRKNVFAETIEATLEDLGNDPDIIPVGHWWSGLVAKDPADAIARLNAIDPPDAAVKTYLADLWLKSGETVLALALFREAGGEEDAAAPYARRSALFLAGFLEDSPTLRDLLADSRFRNAVPTTEQIRHYAALRDYLGLAAAILRFEASLYLSPALVPALFTATIWLLIIGWFRKPSAARVLESTAAFALGILAAALTLYAVVVQEDINGFRSSPADPAMAQLIYYLAGVGLREEFLKLLCFVPLAIRLKRGGTALDALVLGGIVGLGFAFQENLVYLRGEEAGFLAWRRLLMANVLHFSLTGVASLALWRMLVRNFRGWEECLATFLGVVAAHALYNAILAVPGLVDYAPLSPILVALIAYRYFDPLREHLEPEGQHRRLSPLGIFVMGSVALTCGLLVVAAASMPFRIAVGDFAANVASMIPLAFAFIGRFRDL